MQAYVIKSCRYYLHTFSHENLFYIFFPILKQSFKNAKQTFDLVS